MRNKGMLWIWYGLALLVLVADQISKHFVLKKLIFATPVKALPFLNWMLTFNRGAAFSFLGQAGGWQIVFFSSLALIVSIVIAIWLWRLPETASLTACALGLILGGALGNLVDRIQFGYVVDFIDFHIQGWHFATFNVADGAITIGVVLLLLGVITRRA